jgi:hypothetical protein
MALKNELPLNPVVNIIVNLSTISAPRKAFDLACLIGDVGTVADFNNARVVTYDSVDSMLSAGFPATSRLVHAAQLLFGQQKTPKQVMIGKIGTVDTAGQNTYTVGTNAVEEDTVTFDGVTITAGAVNGFAVGETVFVTLNQAGDLCNEDRGELDMVFSFEHMGCDDLGLKWFKTRLSPKRLMKTLVKWQTGLAWNTNYFENHDQPRFISRFADSEGYREKCSMMMAGLLLTLRGTPFIYEGQEIGMTNGDFRCLKQIQDVESHGVEVMARDMLHIPKKIRWNMIRKGTRDNARTPMQWDASANAGFTTGRPWLRVNGNHKKVNVAADKADPNGVFAFWKYMVSLRKCNPVLIDGDFVPVRVSNQIFAYERTLNDKRLLCVFNMTGKETMLPAHLQWENLLAGNYDDVTPVLRPFEFRLMEASVEAAETTKEEL